MAFVFVFPEVSVPEDGDASNIVRRTQLLVETGMIPPQDPPLRYIPFSLGALIGFRSPIQNIYAITAFFGLPILAASLCAYNYVCKDRRHAAIITIMFVIGLGTGVVRLPWYDNWMYITPLPFVVIALLAVDVSLESERLWIALFAGALTAIVGLQQLLFGGVVVLIATVSYLRRRDLRELILFGLAGTPAAFILILSDYFNAQSDTMSTKLMLRVVDGYPGAAMAVTELDLSGMMSPALSVLIITAVIYFAADIENRSTVISSSAIILVLLILISNIVFVIPWVATMSSLVLQVTLLVGISRVLAKALPEVEKKPRPLAVYSASLMAAGLSILHLLVRTP